MKPSTVRDLMTTKNVLEIGEDDSLASAAHRMAWLGCHHLPVTREHEVVGVVSEADVLRWSAARRPLDGPEGRVLLAMTAPPIVATPDERVGEAAARMIAARVGCLPVVLHGKLVGMLTTTDLLGGYVSEMFEWSVPTR
jgi:CBS domain-containing protein